VQLASEYWSQATGLRCAPAILEDLRRYVHDTRIGLDGVTYAIDETTAAPRPSWATAAPSSAACPTNGTERGVNTMSPEHAVLRKRLRLATARYLTHAELWRSGALISDQLAGYAYTKRNTNTRYDLPGFAADLPRGQYFMTLYPDELPEVLIGDVLLFASKRSQQLLVVAVHDYGAYVTLRIEEAFNVR
jgi:hypothetical protein